MDFEAQWAIIEAFIESEAPENDAATVDEARELVRYGEVPIVVGPGMGLPTAPGTVLRFSTTADADKARSMMDALAEQMLLEPQQGSGDGG